MNRTLQDKARSILTGAGVGGGFWVEWRVAVAGAGLSKTPEELWSQKTPMVRRLRAYGSKAYVSYVKSKREGKMSARKWEAVVVGYPIGSVGYRMWDPVRGKVFAVGVRRWR